MISIKSSGLLVRAPAFGVRVFAVKANGNEQIDLQWLDEGGHGYPWETLLIRVTVDATTDSLRWLLPDNAVHWDATDLRVLQDMGTGSFRITIDGWPSGASHVLVLTVSVLERHDSHRGKQRPYADAELIAAVRRCLAESGGAAQGGLRRTLIRLPDSTNIRLPDGTEIRLPDPTKPPPPLPSQPGKPGPKPTPAQPGLHFALASCHYPHDIFDRMPDALASAAGPADASLLQLARLLDDSSGDKKPSLVLLVGDQVYLDATAGLFDPRVLSDRVQRPYQLFFGSQGAQAVFGRADVQTEMLFDDHEFSDNYETGDAVDSGLRERAKKAYWEFQRGGPRQRRLWRTLDHQGFAFFLGDTRM